MKLLCKRILDAFLIRLLVWRGRKSSAFPPSGDVLVLAPHPDDETIACGATIAQMRARGRRVRVMIVSNGDGATAKIGQTPDALANERREEASQALYTLGVCREDIVFLSYPDGKLEAHKESIARDIEAEINAFPPAILFAPQERDGHPDHRAVANAVGLMRNRLKDDFTRFDYIIWVDTRKWVDTFLNLALKKRSTRFPTKSYLDVKKKALSAYKSQTGGDSYEKGKGFLDPFFLSPFLGTDEFFYD